MADGKLLENSPKRKLHSFLLSFFSYTNIHEGNINPQKKSWHKKVQATLNKTRRKRSGERKKVKRKGKKRYERRGENKWIEKGGENIKRGKIN